MAILKKYEDFNELLEAKYVIIHKPIKTQS